MIPGFVLQKQPLGRWWLQVQSELWLHLQRQQQEAESAGALMQYLATLMKPGNLAKKGQVL